VTVAASARGSVRAKWSAFGGELPLMRVFVTCSALGGCHLERKAFHAGGIDRLMAFYTGYAAVLAFQEKPGIRMIKFL
jgi:hypothetical protein